MDHPRSTPTPRPDRRTFVEIRAAAGVADRAEATDFAAEVLRELTRAAERRGWTVQVHAIEKGAEAGVLRAELELFGGSAAVKAR